MKKNRIKIYNNDTGNKKCTYTAHISLGKIKSVEILKDRSDNKVAFNGYEFIKDDPKMTGKIMAMIAMNTDVTVQFTGNQSIYINY